MMPMPVRGWGKVMPSIPMRTHEKEAWYRVPSMVYKKKRHAKQLQYIRYM